MKINQSNALFNQNNTTSRPAFLGVRLYNINVQRLLPDNTRKTIPAYFTMLGAEDVPLLEKINDLWSGTMYGNEIIRGFFSFFKNANSQKGLSQMAKTCSEQMKIAFYMIETDVVNAIEKVKNLAMVSITPQGAFIDYIQSVGEVLPAEKIFGAGAGMLYGVCRQIEQLKIDKITLFSSKQAITWYQKLGFDNSCGICNLPVNKFKAFQKNIAKKYNY